MQYKGGVKQDYLVAFLLIVLFILFFTITYLSVSTYGGADDIVHYRFARYAFKYPYLFFDHWGKPLFTILASPFAQFGFLGVKIFNLIAGLSTAYFTYRVTKLLHYKFNFLVLFLVCFTPVYLTMLLSGMTEILFSFVLILAVFFTLRRNFLWSAIILSLLPFARNEGLVVFPFFLLYYVVHKKYWAIPFVLTGFIFFSVLGAFHYRDIFWVITQMPYTGARDIYGSGELLHFVNETSSTLGIPLAILFVIGFCSFGYQLWKHNPLRPNNQNSLTIQEGLLILLPFLGYFAAHSILWWKGWGGSLGLTRVMAGVVPLVAVFGSKGLDWLIDFLPKAWLKYAAIVVVIWFIIATPFQIDQYPVRLGEGQKVVQKAAFWVRDHGYLHKRIYYYNHYFWFFLDLNPFDPNSVWETVPHREMPSREIPDSCLVIWDAHFSSNDGRLPLETMMNDSMMRLLKVFRPRIPFTVMGGHNYEVCIFQKTSHAFDIAENYKIYDESSRRDTSYQITFKTLNFDSLISSKDKNISDSIAHSGRYSFLMEKQQEFGPGISFQYKELPGDDITRIKAFFWVWARSKQYVKDLYLAASVQHRKKLYFYEAAQCDTAKFEAGKWNQLRLNFTLPEPDSRNDLIKIYPWNKGKDRFYMDDLTIFLGK